MSDRSVTEEDVRREHAGAANQAAHWAYLASVVLVGMAIMLGLIAALGGMTTPG